MGTQRLLRLRSRTTLLSVVVVLGAAVLGYLVVTSQHRPAHPASQVHHQLRGHRPPRGRLLRRVIPGQTSGFVGRKALIYLPPAAERPGARLPVLLLLHGEPGSPSDWLDKSTVLPTLSAFAAHHSGAAPIVVMPDINGTRQADTECVATAHGDVERYLATDVPAYVRAHFRAAAQPRRWAVGGVSEGGMCSLLLALRHPQRFPTFVDLSGLTRPTLGRTDAPRRTVAGLFGGSWATYRQHDPLWLLRRRRYPAMAGWLAAGQTDTRARAALQRVAAAAQRAGITTEQHIEPGGHGWRAWDRAIQQCLPWLWERLTRG